MPGHAEITGIAVVAVVALVCGILMARLRQPAIVGYILAGLLLGPSGFGLVADRAQVALLAELGVLLLLFLIGMELSLRAFARVWRVSLVGAALQIAIAAAVTLALSGLLDWSWRFAVVLGFAVALSSTAVAIKTLEDIGELRTGVGRTAIGVLIAQDLAVVPMLLIIDGMGRERAFDMAILGKIGIAVLGLGLMIRILSRRDRISLPFGRFFARSNDLTAVGALAYCFAAAAASGVLGLSPAYGAFLAGLFIGNTTSRRAIYRATLPVQSVLIMVFFLSIGLLIDLAYIWTNLGTVLLLLAVVTIFKTAMNVALLHGLGEPWPRAFLAGVVLGQIGEFSFLLVAAGVGAAIVGADEQRLMVSVIALSLVTSPLWLVTARRLHNLASGGISSLGELLDQVYGHEARLVAVTSGRAYRLSYRLGAGALRVVNRLRPHPAADSAPAEPPPCAATAKRRAPRRRKSPTDDA